jgi:hypothetical protein
MTRDWVYYSNRGQLEIDWQCIDEESGFTALDVLRRYRADGYTYVEISSISEEIFGIHRSAETLTKAFHRYNKSKKNTPKSRVTHTGIGLTRADYEQMLPGMIIRVNGIEIVRP